MEGTELVEDSVEKVLEVSNLPTPQHAESVFIPETPTNLSKSEPLEEPQSSSEVRPEIDIEPEPQLQQEITPEVEIPPPITHCDLKNERSIDSNSSSSPPPPPPMMADNGPPTAILNDIGFPFPPRALSRISEASSRNPEQEIVSRSGSEGGPDTMTDQNCTTSEDADANPPSLSSDLPENAGPASRVMRAIAEFEARACGSKDLPSPPSSMMNTTEEEVTLEGKTEVTLVEPDSLFLELTADPQMAPLEQTEELDIEEKIPYDLSISSENEVTREEEKCENSEGSLHDSMEILEEIATEDHFDHLPADSDQSFDNDPQMAPEEKDIFEMPPMPDSINDSSHQDPPPGGQEFIF